MTVQHEYQHNETTLQLIEGAVYKHGAPKVHDKTWIKSLWERHEAEMGRLIGIRRWLDKLQKKGG